MDAYQQLAARSFAAAQAAAEQVAALKPEQMLADPEATRRLLSELASASHTAAANIALSQHPTEESE